MRKTLVVSFFMLVGIVVACNLVHAGSCCGGADGQGTCAMPKAADTQSQETSVSGVKPAENSKLQNTAKVKTKNKAVSQIYQCPMHPEVTSDKPGNCPKCGMKLIKMDLTKKSK